MEVNQEKLNSDKSDPWINSDESENKENQLDGEIKSEKTLLEMIKSRPKRCNRKVPSRLKMDLSRSEESTISGKKPTKSGDPNVLDSGLDTFFQSTTVTFKRRTFGDVYPIDETSSSSLCTSGQTKFNPKPSLLKTDIKRPVKDQQQDESSNNDDKAKLNSNKLSPAWADKVSRSRSSPNLIDPRKMLMPGDPRVNLSIIKELRTRQKSGVESEEISNNKNITNNNNNNNHHHPHLSLLSELKAKNKPFCSKNDSAHISLVNREKPLISILKPSSKVSSDSSTTKAASTINTVQQSGQFFNVKLRETKTGQNQRTPVNNLIKSYTRASFAVKENEEERKRKSPLKCKDEDEGDGESDVTGLSKEASALKDDKDEKSNDRSSEESSSSSSSEEDEQEDEDEKENDCHQNKREAIGCCPDEKR